MMKRMVAALLAAVLTLSLVVQVFPDINTVYAATENEQEIPDDYMPIYDIADLYAIRNDLSGNYILMNDIDMTADTSKGGDYDCGTGWDSIEGFEGVLDGNGHRIIGMHIFGEFTSRSQIGLFENLKYACVQNLGIVNCDINITTLDGSFSLIGALSGEIDRCIIRNCYTSGNIAISGQCYDGICVGGLTGGVNYPSYGTTQIQNCYNACEIDVSNIDISEGSGSNILGGICGDGDRDDGIAEITQSYNVGNIKGNTDDQIGGICGNVYLPSFGSSYENCQYLKGSALQGIGNTDDNSNCVALNENQMKNAKLFTGYDFTNTWEIDPYCSYAYPQLRNNRIIRVTSINLKTSPSKLIYNQGETISVSNSALEITYEDGIKTSVPLSLDMLTGYDMMKIGIQTVTVIYGGEKTSFNIEVKEIPASNITNPITTNPSSNGGSGSTSGDNASLIRKVTSTKARIMSAKNAKSKCMTLKLSGLSGCDGYQIQYGLKKNFKGAKAITKKNGSVTIKKLKAKKTYYVRVRTYKKISGNTYYGKWSSRKSVKIKK